MNALNTVGHQRYMKKQTFILALVLGVTGAGLPLRAESKEECQKKHAKAAQKAWAAAHEMQCPGPAPFATGTGCSPEEKTPPGMPSCLVTYDLNINSTACNLSYLWLQREAISQQAQIAKCK